MNSSSPKRPTEPSNENETLSADPFASDIFAATKPNEKLNSDFTLEAEVKREIEWVWRLPKIARPAVDWTKLWQNVPADFSGNLPGSLARSLTGYLSSTNENLIEFLFFTKRETNEKPETAADSWWASVGIEGSAAEFAVEIDKSFAAWLVDATLGEVVPDRVSVRDLTPSETAVLEFLAANLTHEANGIVNAPLFKLLSISCNSPVWITPRNAEMPFSLFVSTWQIIHGFQQSIVKIYLLPETLQALQIGENKLLTAPPRRAALRRSLEGRLGRVRTRLSLGETQVTLTEIAGLETGDVILIENYDFSVNRHGLYGNAEIFLGDGEQIKITGTFEPSAIEPPNEFSETNAGNTNKSLVRRIESNHRLQFSILYFEESENAQFLDKSMPEENANLTDQSVPEQFDNQATGVSLENLAVTLRVELEARRLSLAEVGNLRVNQVIELGARATDPVNLLIDNKTVARGELVEVEDRLGVRIIQILR